MNTVPLPSASSLRTDRPLAFCLALLIMATGMLTGCQKDIDPKVPEPIRTCREPEGNREYLLYRPSSYSRDLQWPLVVVCHTSFPDSPNQQIRNWTELAESKGFIVVAPKLRGTKRLMPPNAATQIELQREDERRILAAVQHARGGHSISDDRIFIHGWSGGAYAALYTGLKNPEVFRAISLLQPRFQSGFLADVQGSIDLFQPIYANYSSSDAITGRNARDCVKWLREKGTTLKDDGIGPARAAETHRAIEFFETVIRKHPFLRIHAFPAAGDNPLKVRFKLRSSYEPTAYQWTFDDGTQSPVAEPEYVFPAPGTYRVTVAVEGAKRQYDHRAVDVDVPHIRVKGPARPTE